MEITDLAFPTAERGIAAGAIYDKASGREKDVSLTTSDGGAHWSLQPLKEYPRSIYFLNDSMGWMVTDKGLWFTEESGKNLEEAERAAQAGQESGAGDNHRTAAAGLVSR